MKIVVIGGTGLIGSQLVTVLRKRGQEVVAASPNSGVNTLTGAGVAAALTGAQVVVDVSNSPSLEGAAALSFFETSSGNLLAAEKAAGTRHHVALSIVGAERLPDSGYMRAKVAQERLIRGSGVPYTIVRSTQFFEFMSRIGDSGSEGKAVRVSSALVQPIASEEAVAALAEVVLGPPVNGTVEVAGPEKVGLDELVRRAFSAGNDTREVIGDIHAKYFGAELNDQSLVAGSNARISATRFDSWLDRATRRMAEPA